MISTDGINWTGHTSLIRQISCIVYSPERAQFLAVGGVGTTFSVSTDGVTWSAPVTVGVGSNFTSVAWAPSLGLYASISVGLNAQTGIFAFTSPDGITWTQRVVVGSGAYDWVSSIAWSPTLSMFIAIGNASHWYRSKDGLTWTVFSPQNPDGLLMGTGPAGAMSTCIWDPDHAVFLTINCAEMGISSDGYGWQSIILPTGLNTVIDGAVMGYSSSLKQLVVSSMASPVTTPYPIVFAVNLSGQVANVTHSSATGFLGVGMGANPPQQQLDVGGYVRVKHPYFRGTGVTGVAAVIAAYSHNIGSSLANLVTVGNACLMATVRQSFFAPTNCMVMTSCCANVGPSAYLQLVKTDVNGQVAILAQNTNFGTTYNYASVATTVPMETGEYINARSNNSIFDLGSSFTGTMLFAT